MMNRTREGFKFYFNIHTMENSWDRPDGVRKDHSLLTREEIQVIISTVSIYDTFKLKWDPNVKDIF